MTILASVKTALRIKHNELDDLLNMQIATAQAEMVRNGISSTVAADSNNNLVTDAIITFCQMRNADTISESERYEGSWKYQLDCLRKSTLAEPNPEPEPEPTPDPEPEPEPEPEPDTDPENGG